MTIPEYAHTETLILLDGHPVAASEEYSIRFVRSGGGPARAALFRGEDPVKEPHRFLASARTRDTDRPGRPEDDHGRATRPETRTPTVPEVR